MQMVDYRAASLKKYGQAAYGSSYGTSTQKVYVPSGGGGLDLATAKREEMQQQAVAESKARSAEGEKIVVSEGQQLDIRAETARARSQQYMARKQAEQEARAQYEAQRRDPNVVEFSPAAYELYERRKPEIEQINRQLAEEGAARQQERAEQLWLAAGYQKRRLTEQESREMQEQRQQSVRADQPTLVATQTAPATTRRYTAYDRLKSEVEPFGYYLNRAEQRVADVVPKSKIGEKLYTEERKFGLMALAAETRLKEAQAKQGAYKPDYFKPIKFESLEEWKTRATIGEAKLTAAYSGAQAKQYRKLRTEPVRFAAETALVAGTGAAVGAATKGFTMLKLAGASPALVDTGLKIVGGTATALYGADVVARLKSAPTYTEKGEVLGDVAVESAAFLGGAKLGSMAVSALTPKPSILSVEQAQISSYGGEKGSRSVSKGTIKVKAGKLKYDVEVLGETAAIPIKGSEGRFKLAGAYSYTFPKSQGGRVGYAGVSGYGTVTPEQTVYSTAAVNVRTSEGKLISSLLGVKAKPMYEVEGKTTWGFLSEQAAPKGNRLKTQSLGSGYLTESDKRTIPAGLFYVTETPVTKTPFTIGGELSEAVKFDYVRAGIESSKLGSWYDFIPKDTPLVEYKPISQIQLKGLGRLGKKGNIPVSGAIPQLKLIEQGTSTITVTQQRTSFTRTGLIQQPLAESVALSAVRADITSKTQAPQFLAPLPKLQTVQVTKQDIYSKGMSMRQQEIPQQASKRYMRLNVLPVYKTDTIVKEMTMPSVKARQSTVTVPDVITRQSTVTVPDVITRQSTITTPDIRVTPFVFVPFVPPPYVPPPIGGISGIWGGGRSSGFSRLPKLARPKYKPSALGIELYRTQGLKLSAAPKYRPALGLRPVVVGSKKKKKSKKKNRRGGKNAI